MSTTARQQHEKDRKDLAKANSERGITRNVATPSTEVHSDADGVTVHAFGGRAYVKTDGEVVLDQDGIFRLRKTLDAALQAVS